MPRIVTKEAIETAQRCFPYPARRTPDNRQPWPYEIAAAIVGLWVEVYMHEGMEVSEARRSLRTHMRFGTEKPAIFTMQHAIWAYKRLRSLLR